MDPKRPDTPSVPPPTASGETMPGGFPPSPGSLERALEVVTYLRAHCEWDRRQTALTLVPYLLEEAHETAEAIRSGDAGRTRDELGDLLLNVAFQVIVAEEAGQFSRDDVIRSLEEKMVRRHPHIFGLGENETWESIKARERRESLHLNNPDAPAVVPDIPGCGSSILDSVPMHADPLSVAHDLQARASEVGFDWEHPSGALEKTREEVLEVAEAMESGSHAALHEEIGDLLFSVVNLARLARCHAPSALASANRKFSTRFRAVESLAETRGLKMPGTSLEDLDALWDEVKHEERGDTSRGGTSDS
jgi:MazG family protein